ncbi:hypothetical protein RR48_00147 [Papilio machaon]|uniref:Uncharacterized protein n=1 Tax=Papilio machaon TaxID=76193 RepID=A0A0N0PFF9_PAPMA|nr:hypothetical protein RR48_00147 [Papilio machaon]
MFNPVYSQVSHYAANLLWNNLLEPVGNKSDNVPPVLLKSFRCPTPQAPFFFTANNSRTFLLTGRQDGAEHL